MKMGTGKNGTFASKDVEPENGYTLKQRKNMPHNGLREKEKNVQSSSELTSVINDHEDTLSDTSSEPSASEKTTRTNDSNENGQDDDQISTLPLPSTYFHLDQHKPPTLKIEINVVAWLLFLIALGLRVWRLDHPRSIVFDELHYGRFVSLYIKGIFFFDSQPPLGKQLIAATAYFAGYNGENNFTAIGGDYAESVPLKGLRLLPALCGSLLVPTVYHFVLEMGLKHRTATLAAIFVLLENSLLTQSRFILMDSIQMLFSMFGLFATLKARKDNIFSQSWCYWSLVSSSSLAFGLCVKYSGLYSLLLALTLSLYDLWWVIPNKAVKVSKLWIQLLAYFVNFIVWPMVIYSLIFYVHLSWLTRAGPHDSILTSAFQASLEGGLASITKGQPLEIVHGSQITLRHTHGRTCWLHSHAQVYPVRYSDNRGSSHQQQVTCYSFKDVNNWWIVKRPEISELVVSEPLKRVKNGELVQLIHGITGRPLNSHDVAAAMSPSNQEVSCYIDYNISMPSQNLWKVSLLNADDTNGVWHTIRSRINLIHVNSSQALKFTGKQYPDWAFNQHEVATDRIIHQDDTVWNVEEHRYTKSSDEKQRERDMVGAEFVPLTETQLNFWEKMKELQYKMLFGSNDKIEGHMFENESPLSWLTLSQGIAYWISADSNAQIHLIGNVILWFTSLAALLIILTLFTYYLLRRRRKYFDIPEALWEKLTLVLRVCFIGYLANLLPYFFMERSLFLHHYLPSLLFQIIVTAALTEFLEYYAYGTARKRAAFILFCLLLVAVYGYCFVSLLSLSYGSGNLSAQDIKSLKWRDSWQLIIHKN